MVQHHVKYKELHGYDEIVMMTMSDHKLLHQKLRREQKCNIPSDELHKIAMLAHKRTQKYKHGTNIYAKKNVSCQEFCKTMMPYVGHREDIRYNLITKQVWFTFRFCSYGGKELFYIDI